MFVVLLKAHVTLLNLGQRDDGQGLVEYSLILALIAVICIVALSTLQGGIGHTLNSVTARL